MGGGEWVRTKSFFSGVPLGRSLILVMRVVFAVQWVNSNKRFKLTS